MFYTDTFQDFAFFLEEKYLSAILSLFFTILLMTGSHAVLFLSLIYLLNIVNFSPFGFSLHANSLINFHFAAGGGRTMYVYCEK